MASGGLVVFDVGRQVAVARDVGQVGQDDVQRPAHASQQIGLHQAHRPGSLAGKAFSLASASASVRHIGGQHPHASLGRHADRDRAAASAHVDHGRFDAQCPPARHRRPPQVDQQLRLGSRDERAPIDLRTSARRTRARRADTRSARPPRGAPKALGKRFPRAGTPISGCASNSTRDLAVACPSKSCASSRALSEPAAASRRAADSSSSPAVDVSRLPRPRRRRLLPGRPGAGPAGPRGCGRGCTA